MTFKQIGENYTSERDGMEFKIEKIEEGYKIHIQKRDKKKWVYPYERLDLAMIDCENIMI